MSQTAPHISLSLPPVPPMPLTPPVPEPVVPPVDTSPPVPAVLPPAAPAEAPPVPGPPAPPVWPAALPPASGGALVASFEARPPRSRQPVNETAISPPPRAQVIRAIDGRVIPAEQACPMPRVSRATVSSPPPQRSSPHENLTFRERQPANFQSGALACRGRWRSSLRALNRADGPGFPAATPYRSSVSKLSG